MKHIKTGKRRKFFEVLVATRSCQAAMMTLRVGQASSEEVENEHPRSEQWVFVVRGKGRAEVGKRSVEIGEGSLVVIEKGEGHRIRQVGRKALVTVNFYVPPAYTNEGEVRRGVK